MILATLRVDHERVVADIICRTLLVDRETLQPSHHLVEDLGADSLNLLEIVLDINEALAIELPTEGVARIRRVEDLVRLVLQTLDISKT
ncbi:phosphopantetheine-binding protein [Pseudomonas sp. 65/3-MNA-CIBAN-0223]|uniref:phosphopantetheine-binding protein n=1 Tax=Pseudomonas sp. 65/3-MNA-CIBAN-0223 TaxID=3140476 RepID=UPI00333288AA